MVKTRAEEIQDENRSRAERVLEYREHQAPPLSAHMARSVSHLRREALEDELEQGLFRESSNYSPSFEKKTGRGQQRENGPTEAGVVAHSGKSLYKSAQFLNAAPVSAGGAGGAGGTGFRGPGGTVRQTPEVYSPLWLNSNLNLPRDRATINAWSRSFFALNPIVHNAITLHSTYPIAKLNIKCKNQKIEEFFASMIEELDLITLCSQIAQEFWVLGETFVYAELDDRTAKWSRLQIQNPDYVTVKRSAIAGEPIISLRPDENLRRIIFSSRPADIQQRQQLDPAIIEHVRKGENIPLNNFYVSHLARKISPYEVRGTGIIVPCFRQLMLWDKGRECHDEETEVLTDQGFKKFDEVISYEFMADGTNGVSTIAQAYPNTGVKIACFNSDTEELEYHEPTAAHVSYYEGEMYHFDGDKVDIQVTPEHDMWIKQKRNNYWTAPQKIKAKNLQNLSNKQFRFQTKSKWLGKHIDQTVDVIGHKVPTNLYLEILGYIISEGCIYSNFTKDKDDVRKNRYDAIVTICQNTDSKFYPKMRSSFEKFAALIGKKASCRIAMFDSGFSEGKPKEKWDSKIHGKDIVKHFTDEVATNGKCGSHDKRIPRWVMELDKSYLTILLNALIDGDGSRKHSLYNEKTKAFSYSTVSQQLADDVYEIVYKCGFTPTLIEFKKEHENGNELIERIITWSNTNYGNEPHISLVPKTYGKNGGGAGLNKVDYSGNVWCFTVPTGLFITRRNGRITIQGNSKFAQFDGMINPLTLVKVGNEEFRPTPTDLAAWRDVFEAAQYDRDFKIFTHNAVTVERVGWASGIYDISPDITQIIKEIYIGLMVPSVIMDGADTTYATGSVSLDVLRQRYMSFRNMLSAWLKRKIFAPISKLNDFYEYKDGEKKLIVPDIDWNHMSLFDMSDYIQNLSHLRDGDVKQISLQTLYKSLGVSYEDEQRKIRYENVQDAIHQREIASLGAYSLNDLRALGPNDEIEEMADAPLPGEQEQGGGEEGGGGMGGGLNTSMPPAPGSSGPGRPVGRPLGPQPPAPGGGTGVGGGGVIKPPPPA